MGTKPEPIGTLFPLGGPVPSDLIIGRRGEIEEISERLQEGMSTMLAGERRIGKTTVCAAVCERLKSQGALVIEVDVPERPDSRALLQLIIDACSRVSLAQREPLTERFSRAGLLLEDTPREALLKWSEGRPYATMAAARYAAQSARRTSSDTATGFDVQMGIDEADRHLHDDGA